MKLIVHLIFLGWVLILCNPALADSGCSYCGTNSPGVDKDIVIRCLVGRLVVDPVSPLEARQVIRCVIEEWKRKDGAIGVVISDAFLVMMESNPQAFFDVMKENEAIFSEWINQLSTLSFTWYRDPPSPLEDKRKKMVQFLTKVGPLERGQDILRQKLLSTLMNIKPRQVE